MKIAIIAHLRFPIREPFAGGLEMHTHLLATELTNRSHDVTLFASPGSGPGYKVHEVPHPAPAADASPEAEAVHQLGISATYLYVQNQIALGDFDVVHNNSLHEVPLLEAYKLAASMVTVLHSPPLGQVKHTLGVLADHAAGQLVAVSEFTADQWRSRTHISDVVPNGIRLLDWPYSATPRKDHCAFVGRIVPDKGVHLAIEAARLAGKQLSVAGPIGDQDYFDTEVAPLLDDERRYVGHLDGQQTAALLGSAECLVFSSVWDEPFGLVLIEAMACGTPVAAFDVGAMGTILDANTRVLVAMGDAVALADAIRAASKLDREKCRRQAAAHYSIEKMVDGYEAIYEEEVGRDIFA